MSDMSRYKIHDAAQKSVRVFLIDPATGEKTSDWLEIRSSLSDKFMECRDEVMQEVQSVNEPHIDKRKEIVKNLQLRLSASLVSGWSFPEDCKEEEIVAFLKEAPQVRAMVMSVADDQARFFTPASKPSSAGVKRK